MGGLEHQELTEQIIGCAMKVHRALGPGFLESVYHNALRIELIKAGLRVESERPIPVMYDGHCVGNFFADMLVNEVVLIELKAIQALAIEHEIQLVNYLTATEIEIGLLINFGGDRLKVKRKSRTYCPKGQVNPDNPV